MRVLPLSLAVLCAWAPLALARDIYVDNSNGYDGNTGNRPRSEVAAVGPVATIAKALRLAQAGDRIVIAATEQPYRETLSLEGSRHSASTVRPFVIEGGGATLDGSAPVPADAWKNHLGDVFYFEPARLAYQQLFLARPRRRSPADHRRGRFIAAARAPGMVPGRRANLLSRRTGAPAHGVRPGLLLAAKWDHVLPRGRRDRPRPGDSGLRQRRRSAHDAWGGVALEGLDCHDNGRAGIAVMGASRVEVDHCELAGNGAAQLHLEGPSITAVHSTKLADDTAAPLVHRDGSRLSIDGKAVSP